MKISKILDEIIGLLAECDEKTGMVEWIITLKQRLEKAQNLEDGKKVLKRIRTSTGGMGSLSDIHLIPKPNSNLGEEEANTKLRELTHALYIEVKSQLNEVG